MRRSRYPASLPVDEVNFSSDPPFQSSLFKSHIITSGSCLYLCATLITFEGFTADSLGVTEPSLGSLSCSEVAGIGRDLIFSPAAIFSQPKFCMSCE